MREILFRGKRVDDGKFVYGYVGVFKGITQIYVPFTEEEEKENEGHIFSAIGGLWHTVHHETVGQFIGLTDRNGKRIFEGDLLNGFDYPFYRSESNEHNYFAEVVWFDDVCAFGLVTHKHPTSKVRGISAGNADFIEGFDPNEWEVIGNIYDNPELMGPKKGE